jgi:hypothetical protein
MSVPYNFVRLKRLSEGPEILVHSTLGVCLQATPRTSMLTEAAPVRARCSALCRPVPSRQSLSCRQRRRRGECPTFIPTCMGRSGLVTKRCRYWLYWEAWVTRMLQRIKSNLVFSCVYGGLYLCGHTRSC